MQIVILALEPIESRYTSIWLNHLPKIIRKRYIKQYPNSSFDIFNLTGDIEISNTSSGAFLNFALTNIWKNNQMNKLFNLINSGTLKSGCKILFPDAWHPGIVQLKYYSELNDFKCEIHTVWHAGSYDTQDFLGKKVKDKMWSFAFERSLYYASDYSYFATDYHLQMFLKNLNIFDDSKCILSGFPFEYIEEVAEKYKDIPKEDIILFPHRISDEKQPEIFKDLAAAMPEYKFIMCQKEKLSKDEYHTLLAKSKLVFSANLQETLGIGVREGLLFNCMVLVPNRLSYTEMYGNAVKYPSEWTIDYDTYLNYKYNLIVHIKRVMKYYDTDREYTIPGMIKQTNKFFHSNIMIDNILKTK